MDLFLTRRGWTSAAYDQDTGRMPILFRIVSQEACGVYCERDLRETVHVKEHEGHGSGCSSTVRAIQERPGDDKHTRGAAGAREHDGPAPADPVHVEEGSGLPSVRY